MEEYIIDEELKTFTLIFIKLDILDNMDAFCMWRAFLKRECNDKG